MRKQRRIRLAGPGILFLFLILVAVTGMCADSPRGKVRIYGYKDAIATKSNKYAPRAVLQDVAEAKHLNLYLKYTYQKFSGYRRCWLVEVIDGEGKTASYPGDLNIYLPYPSAWSATYQDYWKWSKGYAERFDWYYMKGYAQLYYGDNASVVASAGRFDSTDTLRQIQPSNEFGFEIPMFHGLKKKAIMLFCDSGIDSYEINREWDDVHTMLYHTTLIFDNREESLKRRKPLLWLTKGKGAVSASTY